MKEIKLIVKRLQGVSAKSGKPYDFLIYETVLEDGTKIQFVPKDYASKAICDYVFKSKLTKEE